MTGGVGSRLVELREFGKALIKVPDDFTSFLQLANSKSSVQTTSEIGLPIGIYDFETDQYVADPFPKPQNPTRQRHLHFVPEPLDLLV